MYKCFFYIILFFINYYFLLGWMIRKTEGTRDGIYDVDFWMLNIQGNVFRSTKTAIEFLTNSKDYDQSDIDKITTELEKERRQARMLKYDWLENDPSVPIGWRLRHVDGKSARRTFFLSKDGFQFACRRAAYQHMITGKKLCIVPFVATPLKERFVIFSL